MRYDHYKTVPDPVEKIGYKKRKPRQLINEQYLENGSFFIFDNCIV